MEAELLHFMPETDRQLLPGQVGLPLKYHFRQFLHFFESGAAGGGVGGVKYVNVCVLILMVGWKVVIVVAVSTTIRKYYSSIGVL